MLCAPVKELPEGSAWEYELKLDGYRALGFKILVLDVKCLVRVVNQIL